MNTKELKNNMVSLEASEGMSLRRKGSTDYSVMTKVAILKDKIDEWEEVSVESIENAQREQEQEQLYKKRVVELIREKYDEDDEAGLKRKMLAMNWVDDERAKKILTEFQEFDDFVEECKVKAKQEIFD